MTPAGFYRQFGAYSPDRDSAYLIVTGYLWSHEDGYYFGAAMKTRCSGVVTLLCDEGGTRIERDLFAHHARMIGFEVLVIPDFLAASQIAFALWPCRETRCLLADTRAIEEQVGGSG